MAADLSFGQARAVALGDGPGQRCVNFLFNVATSDTSLRWVRRIKSAFAPEGGGTVAKSQSGVVPGRSA